MAAYGVVVLTDKVLVGVLPVLLSAPVSALPLLSRGQHLRIRPMDGTVFVGLSEALCSPADGFPVFEGEALFEDALALVHEVWCVAAAGVVEVRRMVRVWPAAAVKR